MSSAGIFNLSITSLQVDNFNDRALWCKPTGINYNMHGWILCRYCATGWFWWISSLRAVTMWSSSSFTIKDGKSSRFDYRKYREDLNTKPCHGISVHQCILSFKALYKSLWGSTFCDWMRVQMYPCALYSCFIWCGRNDNSLSYMYTLYQRTLFYLGM